METHVYRAGLPPTELADELHRLGAVRRQSLWLVCRYLADLADSGGYRDLDYDDVYAFAWRELAMPIRRTRERVRVGRALRVLPRIESSFVIGRIGFARVREIVRVATPATEDEWLQAALELPRRSLESLVANAAGAWADQEAARIAGPKDREPQPTDAITLQLPREVWELLQDAIEAARTAEGAPLSNEAAMRIVATEAMRALLRPVPNLGDDGGGAEHDPTGTPTAATTESSPAASGSFVPQVDPGAPATDDPVGSPPEPRIPGCEWAEEVQLEALGDDARTVLGAIKELRTCQPDRLAARTGQTVSALLLGFAELELAGLLERGRHTYRLVRFQDAEDG